MIALAFGLITLAAAAVATFVGDTRRATLALWVAGLGVGCVFLTIGAEALAVIQWILSTLAGITFIFFSIMFGEYGKDKAPRTAWRALSAKDRKLLLVGAASVMAGLVFAWLTWRGAGPLPEEALSIPVSGNDLQALGKTLTEEHLLSLEVLAIMLFAVLVGGGVIARPEKPTAERGSP